MWSPLNVDWTSPAAKQLRKLPIEIQAQAEAAVNRYAVTGVGDVKALKGRTGQLRLRVGNYRTIFVIALNPGRMSILAIAHRREIY